MATVVLKTGFEVFAIETPDSSQAWTPSPRQLGEHSPPESPRPPLSVSLAAGPQRQLLYWDFWGSGKRPE